MATPQPLRPTRAAPACQNCTSLCKNKECVHGQQQQTLMENKGVSTGLTMFQAQRRGQSIHGFPCACMDREAVQNQCCNPASSVPAAERFEYFCC